MSTIHLSPDQKIVLTAMRDYGKPLDDVGLAVYVQHVAGQRISSSGVRTRRAELVRKGLVAATGVKRTASNRNQAIWGITILGRRALRQNEPRKPRATPKVRRPRAKTAA